MIIMRIDNNGDILSVTTIRRYLVVSSGSMWSVSTIIFILFSVIISTVYPIIVVFLVAIRIIDIKMIMVKVLLIISVPVITAMTVMMIFIG